MPHSVSAFPHVQLLTCMVHAPAPHLQIMDAVSRGSELHTFLTARVLFMELRAAAVVSADTGRCVARWCVARKRERKKEEETHPEAWIDLGQVRKKKVARGVRVG